MEKASLVSAGTLMLSWMSKQRWPCELLRRRQELRHAFEPRKEASCMHETPMVVDCNTLAVLPTQNPRSHEPHTISEARKIKMSTNGLSDRGGGAVVCGSTLHLQVPVAKLSAGLYSSYQWGPATQRERTTTSKRAQGGEGQACVGPRRSTLLKPCHAMHQDTRNV